MQEFWVTYAKKIKMFTIKEKVISGAFVFVVLLLGCIIAFSQGKVAKIDSAAVLYEKDVLLEQNKEYKQKQKELSDLELEVKKIDDELADQQELLNTFNDYKTNKENKDAELVQLDNSIAEKTNSLTSLDTQVQEKQNELDKLTGAITKAKSEKILTAGVYTVGVDVEIGTYDVQLVSGKGNFFVRGSTYVNEIFGKGFDMYIQEYKNMTISYGDEIEVCGSLKVKLLK